MALIEMGGTEKANNGGDVKAFLAVVRAGGFRERRPAPAAAAPRASAKQ